MQPDKFSDVVAVMIGTTRFFLTRRAAFPAPAPTGLRPKAQGCEERATLGKRIK
jgi:hypothetical protein